jgi:predicted transcriptional regulator of viral defense system
MQRVTELAILKAADGVFTRTEVAFWVDNEGARLDALLKRAVNAGEVLHIRRGLFCLADKYLRRRIHAFALAQRVYGPSYVSLESALMYHNWIPEAVYAVTSVSSARSRTFDTPIGLYSFTRVPQRALMVGVRREALEGNGCFLLAEPLKALADYVYVHSCDWQGAAPVVGSLRVDEADLATLTTEPFERLGSVYRSGRVNRFLAGLRKDLGL